MATTKKTHAPSMEGQERIAKAIEALAVGGSSVLKYDEAKGRYDNASIKAWLDGQADGKLYGISIPKSAATVCTKTGANAGMAVPKPGIVGRPAVDPYVGQGAFRFYEVNGGVDPDGTPYVTAIRGDGRFTRTGADVWILTPLLWWTASETDTTVEVSVSDAKLAGLGVQPQGQLPSGDHRPYMLYAKYWLGEGDGYTRSGQQADVFDVSHNSMITKTSCATTGYSGFTHADYWYPRVMFLLKYATKNSQSVFSGATSWSSQVHPSVAESGTRHVVVKNADAGGFVVGGTVSLGSALDGEKAVNDRQDARTRDKVDRVGIVAIESYDADNKAVVLDSATAFDTATTDLLSTMVWNTGGCDMVEGDGSPSNPTGGKEPFVIQGIELMGGFYEILGNVIFHSTGEGWHVLVNPDTKDEKTAYDASVYEDTGMKLPTGDGVYPLYPSFSKQGLPVIQGTGGSQSAGLCDCKWGNGDDTTGDREFRSCGNLGDVCSAGLWTVIARNELGTTWWSSGSRASAIGRGVRAA